MSYDNACKFLAEQYPGDFLRQFLIANATTAQVLKTELIVEPIRADSVTFVRAGNSIGHLEFETLPKSDRGASQKSDRGGSQKKRTPRTPIPMRMLDYYTRLKRQYNIQICQAVIFLKETSSPLVFESEYRDENTWHRYNVIRLWEQDPKPFLTSPALLPLAPLARSKTPETLLEQVAAEVAKIPNETQRQNISGCTQILAGLRHKENVIRQLFQGDIMQESVIYQDIVQKEAARFVSILIEERFGDIALTLKQQIQKLSREKLELLGKALLSFSSVDDLRAWLAERAG